MTRVIKLGGRAQGDARLPARLAEAAAQGPLVVVHGGGDEVSALQRRLGLEPAFVGGRRVTTEADLEIVRMVLSGSTNKRLVAQLIGAGARAVGVSGEDAGLITARATDAATFGRVGGELQVDASLLRALLAGGYLPVVSPLARDREAPAAGLNVNGDDAAAAVAGALGADELLLLADVPGVLEDTAVVQVVDEARAADLVSRGIAQGGMKAKLEAAQRALALGVAGVRIAGLEAIADRGTGTRVVTTQGSSPVVAATTART